jgi:hypothetical protein
VARPFNDLLIFSGREPAHDVIAPRRARPRLQREGARLKKPATGTGSEMRQQDTGEKPARAEPLRELAQINSNFYATARSAPAGH